MFSLFIPVFPKKTPPSNHLRGPPFASEVRALLEADAKALDFTDAAGDAIAFRVVEGALQAEPPGVFLEKHRGDVVFLCFLWGVGEKNCVFLLFSYVFFEKVGEKTCFLVVWKVVCLKKVKKKHEKTCFLVGGFGVWGRFFWRLKVLANKHPFLSPAFYSEPRAGFSRKKH